MSCKHFPDDEDSLCSLCALPVVKNFKHTSYFFTAKYTTECARCLKDIVPNDIAVLTSMGTVHRICTASSGEQQTV